MKYIKTFEGFSVNENASDINSVMSLIDGKIESLPEEERQKIFTEVQAIADKLGVSMEELSDPDFAAKLMIEEADKVDAPVEENWMGDAWDWLKNRSASWYRTVGRVLGWGGGITGFATMISSIVIAGAEKNTLSLYLRELTGISELDRNTQAAMFLAGLTGLIISIFAGGGLIQKGDDMDRATKYGSRF